MNWKAMLVSMLSEKDGKTSSLRVIFTWTGMLFSTAFVVVWTVVSFRAMALADVPSGVYELMAVLLLGKGVQRGVEAYQNAKVTPVTPQLPEGDPFADPEKPA